MKKLLNNETNSMIRSIIIITSITLVTVSITICFFILLKIISLSKRMLLLLVGLGLVGSGCLMFSFDLVSSLLIFSGLRKLLTELKIDTLFTFLIFSSGSTLIVLTKKNINILLPHLNCN